MRDREILVPELAGWRRARMPEIPDAKGFDAVAVAPFEAAAFRVADLWS